MHDLFDCDNCNTLRQDTLKKIKAIDNNELDTRNKLQKPKILLSDGSVKPLIISGKYINRGFQTRAPREKESLS